MFSSADPLIQQILVGRLASCGSKHACKVELTEVDSPRNIRQAYVPVEVSGNVFERKPQGSPRKTTARGRKHKRLQRLTFQERERQAEAKRICVKSSQRPTCAKLPPDFSKDELQCCIAKVPASLKIDRSIATRVNCDGADILRIQRNDQAFRNTFPSETIARARRQQDQ